MSHFTSLKTKIAEADALVEALRDVGFDNVEVYETAQPLYGYQGDVRSQTAEVIIRREFVGRASNDIGFKRGLDGMFEAIISGFDRAKYSETWIRELTQRYAYHASKAKLEAQGFSIASEETTQNGQIHLQLRRTA